MYNIFKDINKERYSMRLIVIITISICVAFCAMCFFYCIYVIKTKEKLIYVLDGSNAFKLAKIHNVTDNRLYEVKDFSRQLCGLAFNFSSDVNFNRDNLKLANSFFVDASFTRYIETLENSQFFQDMASKNMTQAIWNLPGNPPMTVTITGGQSPYAVVVEFFVLTGNVYKKITVQATLTDVFRSDLNSHGFNTTNFVVDAVQLEKQPE